MKVKICDIKPNPFKRFINEGELDIDRLKEIPNFESIKPELVARHRYLKKVFCNVERQAKMYRKMQEEIGEKLDVELEA